MIIEEKEALFKIVMYAATAITVPLWLPGFLLEHMRDKVVNHYRAKFAQQRADESRD